MTKKEFYRSEDQKKNRKNIISCAITGYVIAVLGLVINLAVFDNPAGIIDAILIIVTSIFIHTLQSRVAAVILAVYGIINMIVTSISMGRVAGRWILLVGVYAVVYTFRFQKAWKEYKESPEAAYDE